MPCDCRPDWLCESIRRQDRHALLTYARQCVRGQRWQWDGVHFEMLHPATDSYQDGIKDNDRGCVLKITSAFGSSCSTIFFISDKAAASFFTAAFAAESN